MRIYLIAAMASNRVIGRENRLPWRLPEDLKRFKELTMGHPVVMGRKTYESIGRLLPGRENIILSRDPGFVVEGATMVRSYDELVSAERARGRELFVIGGAQIYSRALQDADRIYLTEIDAEIEGDAYFPEVPPSFRPVASEERAGDPAFRFVTYEKTGRD
nr:Dihydrofolate reductase [uncultured bacterium]